MQRAQHVAGGSRGTAVLLTCWYAVHIAHAVVHSALGTGVHWSSVAVHTTVFACIRLSALLHLLLAPLCALSNICMFDTSTPYHRCVPSHPQETREVLDHLYIAKKHP
jgi:hypothetical protein